MANPRAAIAFDDIGWNAETYAYDSTIVYDATVAEGAAQVGLAVTLTGNADRTVSTVGDGEKVFGKLLKVEKDGFCAVQTSGFCTFPSGNAAAVTIGSAFVGALNASSAEGYIKAATTAGVARGAIVDNDVLTAIIVKLDS